MKQLFLLASLLLSVCSMSAQQTISVPTIFGETSSLDLRPNSVDYQSPKDMLKVAQRRGVIVDIDDIDGHRWIDRIKNMPSYYCDFYNEYASLISGTLKKESNWTSDYTKAELIADNTYAVLLHKYTGTVNFKLDLSGDVTPEGISNQFGAALKNKTDENWDEANCFVNYLCMSMAYDFPDAFWIDSAFYWAYSVSANNGRYSGTDASMDYEQNIYLFIKTPSFDFRRKELADPSTIMKEVDNYNNAVANILSEVSDKTNRYDVLLGLNNWLTAHNHYNSNYASGTNSTLAWSPLSAICGLQGKDAPVCEGYARAFMALCGELNIPCVVSTGKAKSSSTSSGENHMWNEVKMDDNKWYAVDVTWNDPIVSRDVNVSGYESTKWFLLGNNDIVNTNWTFVQSHPKTSPWPVDEAYTNRWEYNIGSLVTDNGYKKETTAIGNVSADASSASSSLIYTIDGRTVNASISLPRGIYIKNGKKFAVAR